MMCFREIAIMTLLFGSVGQTSILAQSVRDQNARLLKSYLSPRPISGLEWELLQFNLLWLESYDGNVDYVTSFPVIFEPKMMRFRATFNVTERRLPADRSFFELPKAQRESILQGPVDQLLALLSSSFPEVKKHQGLVYAEFWFRVAGGGRSVVAKYENGALSLVD